MNARRQQQRGMTLIELIVAFTILVLLTTMAVPLARNKVRREKEKELRMALREIRTAIDKYKDMADKGQLGQLKADADGYPETLEMLVDGVKVTGQPGGGQAGMGMGMGMMGPQQQQRGIPGAPGQSAGSMSDSSEKKVRFLRRMPKDPFTNSTDWGKRSSRDDPKSSAWGGQNVFDVYSKTMEKAADGTPYAEW
jgi:general secretion pathway protein G